MSILAYLVGRFSAQPENLATEALNFILFRSPGARSALLDLCQHLGLQTREDLAFSTQHSNDDKSRPDLIGRAVDSTIPLAIEVKFWAGLTKPQPAGYLAQLHPSGVLLFVAPEARVDILWPELLQRARSHGTTVERDASSKGARVADSGDRTLALISWRSLLQQLKTAAVLARDPIVPDIEQLDALCEKMDTEGFLPLRSEELTANLGRRVVQFCDLADRISKSLVSRKLASTESRTSGGSGWYCRPMRLRGHAAALFFDAKRWGKHGKSPLWLELHGKGSKRCTVEPDCLRRLGVEFHMNDGKCVIPITLREGVERDAVVTAAVEQIAQLVGVIPDYSAESAPQVPPAPAMAQGADAGTGALPESV